MPKLTDTQFILLCAAAQRADGMLLIGWVWLALGLLAVIGTLPGSRRPRKGRAICSR